MQTRPLKALAALAVVLTVPIATAGAGSAATPLDMFAAPSHTAGYLIAGTGVRAVYANFVVPTVTCPTANASVGFGVGLDDSTDGTFAQIGVRVRCVKGVPHYGAFFLDSVTTPQHLPGRVHPGDRIRVTMTGSASRDLRASLEGAGFGDGLIDDLIVAPTEAGILGRQMPAATGMLPLADFGTLAFTAHLNGGTLSGRATKLTMKSRAGQPKVDTSALNSAHGRFTLTWLRQ